MPSTADSERDYLRGVLGVDGSLADLRNLYFLRVIGGSSPLRPLWDTFDSGITSLQRGHQDDSKDYGQTPGSGVEHFTYFRADKTMTINKINLCLGGNGSTGLTYTAVGLYSVNNDTHTLLGQSAPGTSFGGTYAASSNALQIPVTVTVGTLYAVGILQVGTTPSSILGQWNNALSFGTKPYLARSVSGKSALDTTVSTGLGVSVFPLYYELVP